MNITFISAIDLELLADEWCSICRAPCEPTECYDCKHRGESYRCPLSSRTTKECDCEACHRFSQRYPNHVYDEATVKRIEKEYDDAFYDMNIEDSYS